MTRSLLRLAAATLLAACGANPGELGPAATLPLPAELVGRWEKLEKSMPPITLELRNGAAGFEGQVWLSGVTYTLPARFADSTLVLADPASSRPARFVAVLQKDGTFRVRMEGHDREERLVRRVNND